QDGSRISGESDRYRDQRDEEEWRVRSSRIGPPGKGASQGPHWTQPADRRTDSDQGKDGGEVPRRQGNQGRYRSLEVRSSFSGKGRREAGLLCLLCSSSWIVVPYDLAALHHKLHMLKNCDVLQWVAVHGNDVRPFSGFERADLVGPAEQVGIIDGCGLNSV